MGNQRPMVVAWNSAPTGAVLAVGFDSNNKRILAGTFSSVPDKNHLFNNFARLNSDGTIDSSFNIGTGFNSVISDIKVLSSGKILVAGSFTSYNGTAINRIVRLNSNGTLDSSFNIGSGFDADVDAMAIQPDGKIVVVGFFVNFNGTPQSHITRINSDGSIDATFATNVGSGADSTTISDVALQSDGKIMVAGGFTHFNGTARAGLARLNTDGTLDSGYDAGSIYLCCGHIVMAVAVQPDDMSVVGGTFGLPGQYAARFTSAGGNNTLEGMGQGFNTNVRALTVQSDGKIVAGGDFTSFVRGSTTTQNRIARLQSNGTLDTTFGTNIGIGFDNQVFTIILQTDGKILVGGTFTSFNGTAQSGITRLNSDGTIDATFATTIGTAFGSGGSISALALQSDGKILAGGGFTSYNALKQDNITRLESDGSIDTTFAANIGSGFDSTVRAIAIQSDNKIVAGGSFTYFNGTAQARVTRLNANGTIDTAFASNVTAGADSTVSAVAIQADGKVILGGSFSAYNGTPQSRISRLNADGTIDATFAVNIGTGFDAGLVSAIATQADGKIVLGGTFGSFNGTTQARITRLNSNGTIDSTFAANIGSGISGQVNSIRFQSNDKIIIGGNFTTVDAVGQNRIARLNTDGTRDATFNIGTGFNNIVYALAIQSDDKIVVLGRFTTSNGVSQNRLGRLNADGSRDGGFLSGAGFSVAIGSGAAAINNLNGRVLLGLPSTATTWQGSYRGCSFVFSP